MTDSTCLIGLEHIGHLHLLPAMFQQVHVPPEVAREFGTSLPWLRIEAPIDRALVAALQILVDDGEAEAIALAVDRRSTIVLDDRRARSVARRLGLEIIGTIGLLIRAKRAHLISEVRPLLDQLENLGFYIGSDLREEALRTAGE